MKCLRMRLKQSAALALLIGLMTLPVSAAITVAAGMTNLVPTPIQLTGNTGATNPNPAWMTAVLFARGLSPRTTDQIVKTADISLRPLKGTRIDPDKCFPFHWLKHPEFTGFVAYVGGDDPLCWGAEDTHTSLFEVRANALASCFLYAVENELDVRRCHVVLAR